jgi:peptidoglycan/LPS O-acetylase OafA/YrhL
VLLALLAGLWLAWYATRVAWPTEPLKGFLVTKSVFARLPAFMLGALVAATADAPRWQLRLTPAVRMLLLASASAGLFLLLLSVARMSEKTAEALWPTYHVWEALGWSAIVLALARSSPGLWRAPLVNPVLAVVGKLSYSIYLVHVPVLFYAVFPARALEAGSDALLLRVAFAGLATLVVSALTYLLIERPFLKLKARRLR